jgi:hypothetical protein
VLPWWRCICQATVTEVRYEEIVARQRESAENGAVAEPVIKLALIAAQGSIAEFETRYRIRTETGTLSSVPSLDNRAKVGNKIGYVRPQKTRRR